jgi:hypothetical protein
MLEAVADTDDILGFCQLRVDESQHRHFDLGAEICHLLQSFSV